MGAESWKLELWCMKLDYEFWFVGYKMNFLSLAPTQKRYKKYGNRYTDYGVGAKSNFSWLWGTHQMSPIIYKWYFDNDMGYKHHFFKIAPTVFQKFYNFNLKIVNLVTKYRTKLNVIISNLFVM